MKLPIPEKTWNDLVEANKEAVRLGWAQEGVFATGIGSEYEIGAKSSLLYIGKSAGPLGAKVGSAYDQALSSQASTDWMEGKFNLSAFWQFVDKIDYSRRKIAWTNVCKMDVIGGGKAPSGRHWKSILKPNVDALKEEIITLNPQVTVFATSKDYLTDVKSIIDQLGYYQIDLNFSDGITNLYVNKEGKILFTTKHPQGWSAPERDRVIEAIKIRLR